LTPTKRFNVIEREQLPQTPLPSTHILVEASQLSLRLSTGFLSDKLGGPNGI
jgi:hypothetical protein